MSELAVQTGPAQAGPAPLIAPSPAKARPALAYRPEIDGLRALAVLPVLFTHAGFAGLGGGHLGVDVFFVISGYLITAILLRELDREGRVSIIDFYERRARRILPVLFVVVAASFVAAWIVMLPKEFRDFGQSMVATGSFLSNIFLRPRTAIFCAPAISSRCCMPGRSASRNSSIWCSRCCWRGWPGWRRGGSR